MDTLTVAWILCLVAALWLVGIGAVRVLAHRSGTDQTPGMRGVALTILVLGALALLAAVVLGAIIVTEG